MTLHPSCNLLFYPGMEGKSQNHQFMMLSTNNRKRYSVRPLLMTRGEPTLGLSNGPACPTSCQTNNNNKNNLNNKNNRRLLQVFASNQAGLGGGYWKKKRNIRKQRKWKRKKKTPPNTEFRNKKLLDFNILQANVCGLEKKKTHLGKMFYDKNIHVALLQETLHSSCDTHITGYTSFMQV